MQSKSNDNDNNTYTPAWLLPYYLLNYPIANLNKISTRHHIFTTKHKNKFLSLFFLSFGFLNGNLIRYQYHFFYLHSKHKKFHEYSFYTNLQN